MSTTAILTACWYIYPPSNQPFLFKAVIPHQNLFYTLMQWRSWEKCSSSLPLFLSRCLVLNADGPDRTLPSSDMIILVRLLKIWRGGPWASWYIWLISQFSGSTFRPTHVQACVSVISGECELYKTALSTDSISSSPASTLILTSMHSHAATKYLIWDQLGLTTISGFQHPFIRPTTR